MLKLDWEEIRGEILYRVISRKQGKSPVLGQNCFGTK